MRPIRLLAVSCLTLIAACATEGPGQRGPRFIGKSLPDALYLHKGGFAPAPPSGDIAIIYDTDATVKTVDSNAVKTALGGGGSGTVHVDAVTITGDGSVGSPLAGIASSLTNAGTMSAAHFKRVVNGFDVNGYLTREVSLALANATGTTQCVELPQINAPTGTVLSLTSAVANDSAVLGGAVPQWGPGTSSRSFTYGSVFQTEKTVPWAVFFRAAIVSSSSYAGIGWSNSANTHDLIVGAVASTTYKIAIDGVAAADTGVSIDAAQHEFLITDDGTTIKVFVDDTQRTTALSSGLTNVNAVIYGFASSIGAVTLTRLGYCY